MTRRVRKHAAVGRTEEQAEIISGFDRRRAEAMRKIGHIICAFANGSCLRKERGAVCEAVERAASAVLAIGVADERENWR